MAAAAALRATVDDEEMVAFARRLDATGLVQMLAALRQCGLFAGVDDAHTVADVMAGARVARRHQRLVRRWLRALVANGLLGYDPESGRYSALSLVDSEAVAAGWRRGEERRAQVGRPGGVVAELRPPAGHPAPPGRGAL